MFSHTMLGDNEQSDMYQSYNDIIMHVILNKYKMYKAMHKLKGCSVVSGHTIQDPPSFCYHIWLLLSHCKAALFGVYMVLDNHTKWVRKEPIVSFPRLSDILVVVLMNRKLNICSL